MEDLAIGGPAVQRRKPLAREVSDDEFRLLFDASFTSVVRTVHHITGDRAVAEEIAQEAFIELHLHWGKIRRYDAPAMWVRRVAIRKAQRERHRMFRRWEVERSVARPATVEAARDPEDEVRAAVQALPFKQRAVIVLFYLEDRPMHEVAQLVDCSVSSGWSLLHVARKKLALMLSEEVADDVG
jgi:RNA polymerase sigma factor (sigma-70 family)